MTSDILAPAGKAAKFETIGTVHKGVVISIKQQQQRDINTGAAKTWDNGDPMMEAVIGLKAADADDPITIYARGRMLSAIREAVGKAQAPTVEIGGTLAVKYTADGDPSKPGFTAPKLYQAQYKPPAVGTTDLLDAAPVTSPAASEPQVTADDLI